MIKAILISNSLLLMVQAARYKSYRRSYMIPLHFFATWLGISCGVQGIRPVFEGYAFSKYEIPITMFEDDNLVGQKFVKASEMRKIGPLNFDEKAFLAEIQTQCYINDYFKN